MFRVPKSRKGMYQRFSDNDNQVLYEKLFTLFWTSFNANYDKFCDKYEVVKKEKNLDLTPEETVLGKIYSNECSRFVEDGLLFEHIDFNKFLKNIYDYTIPIKKTLNRVSP